MKAVILVGCSGSGKSTLAREYIEKYGYSQLERDQIRSDIVHKKFPHFNSLDNLWSFWKFKWEDEVTEKFDTQLKSFADLGLDVVISDTNISYSRRESLVGKLKGLGYTDIEEVVVGMNLTLEELWKRDLSRVNSVGHWVIADQYYKFRTQYPLYHVKDVQDKPKAVIFDVDGTLADMGGLRGAFEWSKVHLDNPVDIVISSLVAQYQMGHEILVMSGRDGACRDDTWNWLRRNIDRVAASMGLETFDIQFQLFMRKENDQRSDVIVKKELFFEHVDGKYNVLAAFDDRPKVALGWYDLGIKVIHCANPYIYF